MILNISTTYQPATYLGYLLHKHGLSLNISEKDNSLDLELALSVAEYFRVDKKQAKKIIDTIKSTVSGWRGLAKKVGVSKAEQDRMSIAFTQS